MVALVVIGYLVYANSLLGKFLWDDESQIVGNPLVHSVKNIGYFFGGGTFVDAARSETLQSGLYYKPALMTVYAVVLALFGQKPFFFHFFQVSFHVFNAILLFLLFKRFFKDWLAFFGALVFLVHPINVESVAYISGLQEVLFFLFGISALLLVFGRKHTAWRIGFINVLLLLAIFAKETGLLFFVIVVGAVYLFKRKRRLDYV